MKTDAKKLKIRKGATVEVITGQDKGKKGAVLAVNSETMKIKVQGVKMMTHFDKKDGVKQLEGFIDYSGRHYFMDIGSFHGKRRCCFGIK